MKGLAMLSLTNGTLNLNYESLGPLVQPTVNLVCLQIVACRGWLTVGGLRVQRELQQLPYPRCRSLLSLLRWLWRVQVSVCEIGKRRGNVVHDMGPPGR